jgi:hypothetical protein
MHVRTRQVAQYLLLWMTVPVDVLAPVMTMLEFESMNSPQR